MNYSAAQKKKNNGQIGTLAFYKSENAEDVLCQFVNRLRKDLRELLIRQDDLLKTPVETVVKRIATLEEGNGGVFKVKNNRSKNNCGLFETLFKVKKNGIFLFRISFFVQEIFTFLHYANEESDDIINCFT